MTLDEQVLKKAQREAARLAESEREALMARADYHTAVRRLHLAGGSLRDIAEALGISHQRVQQIVNDAGGSWWRRVWRTRIVKRDAICTFCGRPPGEVEKLIAGPNVYICDACVARAEKTVAAGTDRGPVVLSKSLTARCAFCHKRKSAARPLIVQPTANICGDCLQLCRQILDDRAA
jgi:hypothetical protein